MTRAMLVSFLVILCLARALAARELYVCERPGAARAFQDTPCADPGAAQSIRAVADPPVAAVPLSAGAMRLERAALAALPESLGGAAPHPARANGVRRERAAAADACTHARERRERAYRRDGNRMSFDQRRALQDAMNDACGL
jgi:hypothetical protein